MPLRNRTLDLYQPDASFLGVVAFAVGATTSVKLGVVGELFLGEILLPLLAVGIVFFSSEWKLLGQRPFLAMCLAFAVMLLGYMISDLTNGTRPDQYLRGWGRVLLVFTDFIAYYVVYAKDRRLFWWLILGMATGSAAYLFATHVPLDRWKLGYAGPVTLVLLALSYFLPGRFKALPVLAAALVSVWLDFRSFGVICLVVASYLWLVSGRRGLPKSRPGTIAKFLLAGVSVLLLANWMLAATADKQSMERRDQSNGVRRAGIEVGLLAIEQSPLIGYGSWSENGELSRLYRKLLEKYGGDESEERLLGSNGFGPHSQILQAWVEGGILGAFFFFFLLYQLASVGSWIMFKRQPDLVSPILVFYLIDTGWNALMSPFAGIHRFDIGIGAAILVVGAIERRRGRRAVALTFGQFRQVIEPSTPRVM